MDADNDLRYYYLMKAWKQSDHTSFNFYDAHDINNIYDKSEASIKAGLQERFRNTKVFVLLVGEHTKYLYKYVSGKIEQCNRKRNPVYCCQFKWKEKCGSKSLPSFNERQFGCAYQF